MQTKTMKQPPRAGNMLTGRYLYAVIDGADDLDFGAIGMDGGKVYTVGNDGIAAVVSDVPNARVRPERRRLAFHHEVLKQLRKDHTVLPMAFGLIADGPEAIQRILKRNRDVIRLQLVRLKNKVEMGLHVYWDVPNIFEYIVSKHLLLRQLRDEFFRNGREPSQDDKIELGRTFDRIMTEERAAHTEKVTEVLCSCCPEIKENKPRNEREVMNLACLIDSTCQRQFEEAVFEAAQLFDNHYSFDFNGPWPPHNFVNVNLQLE